MNYKKLRKLRGWFLGAFLIFGGLAALYQTPTLLLLFCLVNLVWIVMTIKYARCPHCGKMLGRIGEKFCGHCGEELDL